MSTDSFLTPNLYQIIFGASDKKLFPSNFNECNKYKIWESIDQNDVKVTRWYKEFLPFFGEYISGRYHHQRREKDQDQVIEQISRFNDNGYAIYNVFSTANSETFFSFIASVQNDVPIINIHMNLTKVMLFDMQYDTSKVASLDLQLVSGSMFGLDGTGHYKAKLIKGDMVKGDEPIIDAKIYDPDTTKSLSIIFNELVPRLMNITSLTRSNELLQRLYNYYINEQLFRTTASSMTSVFSFFNLSGNIGNLKFE